MSPLTRWFGFLALLAGLTQPLRAAETSFPFHASETVVFFGDSITFGGLYCSYVEAFLRTRRPDVAWRFVNAGRSSETLSGLTEKDHPGPRPNAMDRFERDVASQSPTLVIACFGMNDGIYAPFNEERFAAFRTGVQRLIEAVKQLPDARLILLTPPVFYHTKTGQSDIRPDETYGYRTPFLGYDSVLANYSSWLQTRAEPRVFVVDLHTHMRQYLNALKREQVEARLHSDPIHPNATGHMLMTSVLVRALGLPELADECVIAIKNASATAVRGDVSRLKFQDGTLEFQWQAHMPMPRDARWNARSLEIEGLTGKLNGHRLQVTGLPAGEYQLTANQTIFAHASANELAAGLDLLQLKSFPSHAAGDQVLLYLDERRKLEHKLKLNPPESEKDRDAEHARAAAINERIRGLCTPMSVEIRLLRVSPTGR